MAGNASSKKKFRGVASDAADMTLAPKMAGKDQNRAGESAGQMRGTNQAFGEPLNRVSAKIRGLDGLYDDIGEKSGFITDGYLDKQDTPYGEAAKFNFLPPGMDISNQENAEIHDMPMRKLTAESYPGDGWMPAPRDIPE